MSQTTRAARTGTTQTSNSPARDRARKVLRLGAAPVAALALVAAQAQPAHAEGGGKVDVTNTETVQVAADAAGKVDEARVYEQISLQGKGNVKFDNPVADDGLRNLDGFTGVSAKGGKNHHEATVDGEQRTRTVSNYAADKLPLKVQASYTLNGKPIKGEDLSGKDGDLEVHYKVENVTGVAKELMVDDGTGKKVPVKQDVVIPMVGQLVTTLPSAFTDVQTPDASIAGDGHGGTKLTYNMTLFGPIGKPTAEFGYKAHLSNGTLPAANISGVPVNPLTSPSFKDGSASMKQGADKGVQLTDGAEQIDSNLLKLRDGGEQLLAGMIQLRDGANKLNTGLSTEAAPGAKQLADGSVELDTGAHKLDDGTTKAKDGSGKLVDGTGKAKDGANKLDEGAGQLNDGLTKAETGAPALIDGLEQVQDGLKSVDDGLVTMYGGIGDLPEKAKPLHEGIGKLQAGIGDIQTEGTLLNGVDQLRKQINEGADGLGTLNAGVYNESSSAPGAYQKLGCATRVIDQLKDGGYGKNEDGSARSSFDPECYGDKADMLNGIPVLPTLGESNPVKQQILATLSDQLEEGRNQLADPDNLGNPNDSDYIDGPKPDPDTATLQQGLSYIQGRLKNRAVPGLEKVECGLSSTSMGKTSGSPCYSESDVDPATPGVQHFPTGLLQGLDLLDTGVDTLVNGVTTAVQGGIGDDAAIAADKEKLKAGGKPTTLRGGVAGLSDGATKLHDGGLELQKGLGLLTDGSGRLKDGTTQLSSGLGQLDDGAGQLDDGLGQLKDGTGQLTDGTGRLTDGAGRLSTGLDEAADGSGQLSEGMGKATDGAAQIPDGANQLHEKGSTKLKENGQATSLDFGTRYAALEVGSQRALTESMAVGAPEGASGFTAYSYDLAGAENGGGSGAAKGFGGLALIGAAAAAGLVRRKFFA